MFACDTLCALFYFFVGFILIAPAFTGQSEGEREREGGRDGEVWGRKGGRRPGGKRSRRGREICFLVMEPNMERLKW